MKKVFLIFGAMLVFASCSDESAEISELSAEYQISVEVLKSQEFQKFMTSMKNAMEIQSKKQDDFFIATADDTKKIAAIKEIESKIREEKLYFQQVEQLYISKIGISPIDFKVQEEVKYNREVFFNKFPEYKGNEEMLSVLENYFKKEVLNYESFMTERERKVMNKIEN